MRQIAAITIAALLVSGCALPVPIQVAGWGLDGVSVMTTEKTLTDHGLSMVSGRDCSVWRGIAEGQLCVDERGNILTASRPGARPALSLAAPAVEVAAMPTDTGRARIAPPYLRVY